MIWRISLALLTFAPSWGVTFCLFDPLQIRQGLSWQ